MSFGIQSDSVPKTSSFSVIHCCKTFLYLNKFGTDDILWVANLFFILFHKILENYQANPILLYFVLFQILYSVCCMAKSITMHENFTAVNLKELRYALSRFIYTFLHCFHCFPFKQLRIG